MPCPLTSAPRFASSLSQARRSGACRRSSSRYERPWRGRLSCRHRSRASNRCSSRPGQARKEAEVRQPAEAGRHPPGLRHLHREHPRPELRYRSRRPRVAAEALPLPARRPRRHRRRQRLQQHLLRRARPEAGNRSPVDRRRRSRRARVRLPPFLRNPRNHRRRSPPHPRRRRFRPGTRSRRSPSLRSRRTRRRLRSPLSLRTRPARKTAGATVRATERATARSK
jgi:hypothetical protein